MTELTTPLTLRESNELLGLEETILAELDHIEESAYLIGVALATIQRKRLYREHGTWAQYCHNVLGMSKSKGYRLIRLGQAHELLLSRGRDDIPLSEKAADELMKLPEELRLPVAEALEAGGGVTAERIEQIRQLLRGPKAISEAELKQLLANGGAALVEELRRLLAADEALTPNELRLLSAADQAEQAEGRERVRREPLERGEAYCVRLARLAAKLAPDQRRQLVAILDRMRGELAEQATIPVVLPMPAPQRGLLLLEQLDQVAEALPPVIAARLRYVRDLAGQVLEEALGHGAA